MFGSASRMSARSCVFYSRFGTFCFFWGFHLFCLRSYRKPNCATPRLIYMRNQFLTAFAIYINFAIFATKTNQLSQKISFVPLFFLLRHKKSIAKQSFVIYNNSRDGAWCSGSTWASDSHCVGSIPIAPANANTLTCEGVSFIFGALDACILCAPNIKEHTRSVFALSTIGEERKHAFACITQLICIFISNLYLQIL